MLKNSGFWRLDIDAATRAASLSVIRRRWLDSVSTTPPFSSIATRELRQQCALLAALRSRSFFCLSAAVGNVVETQLRTYVRAVSKYINIDQKIWHAHTMEE